MAIWDDGGQPDLPPMPANKILYFYQENCKLDGHWGQSSDKNCPRPGMNIIIYIWI